MKILIILIISNLFLTVSSFGTCSITDSNLRTITCDSLKDIKDINTKNLPNDTLLIINKYHLTSSQKRKKYYWKKNMKSIYHNGAYIIDPNKSFPKNWDDNNQKKDWFTPEKNHIGCWVSTIPTNISILDFGAIPNSDASVEFQKISNFFDNGNSKNHAQSKSYIEISLEHHTFKIKNLKMKSGIRFINGKIDTRDADNNSIIFSQGDKNNRQWYATQFDNIVFRNNVGAKNCTIFNYQNIRNISFINCKAIGRDDKTQTFLNINGVNFAEFNKLWIGNYKNGIRLLSGRYNNNAILGSRLYFQDNVVALEFDDSVHSSSWNMCYFERNDIAVKGKDSSAVFIFPVFDNNKIANILDTSIKHNNFTIITDSYFDTSKILESTTNTKYKTSKNKINFYNIINKGTIKTSKISKTSNNKNTSFKIQSTEDIAKGANLQLYPYRYMGYTDKLKNANSNIIDSASIVGGAGLTVERYSGGFKIVDNHGKHLWKLDWYGRLWFPNDTGYIRQMQSAPQGNPDVKSGLIFTPSGLYVVEDGKWVKK